MTFQCPKCSTRTEMDGSHIPEEGASAKCPECKTRFWIASESFARRAMRKEGKALCSFCNNELSNYLDCPTCGAMYPDINIVQMSKPVARKQRKTSAAVGFSIRPQSRARAFNHQPAEKSSRNLLITISLLVLLALTGAGIGFLYVNSKAEQTYTDAFLRALYALKLSSDAQFRHCATLSASAKTSGQDLAHLVTDKDKSRFASGKNDIDTLIGRIPTPPEKYIKVNNNLAKLYGIYSQSYALSVSPTGTWPAYTDSSVNLENEFKQAAKELKTSMPANLAEKFSKTADKYKPLKDL
jgi:predicted Zn finger-like uncharacterized protein